MKQNALFYPKMSFHTVLKKPPDLENYLNKIKSLSKTQQLQNLKEKASTAKKRGNYFALALQLNTS